MVIPNYDFIEACQKGHLSVVESVLNGKTTLAWTLNFPHLTAFEHALRHRQKHILECVAESMFNQTERWGQDTTWMHRSFAMFHELYRGHLFGSEEKTIKFLRNLSQAMSDNNNPQGLKLLLASLSGYPKALNACLGLSCFKDHHMRTSSPHVLCAITPLTKKKVSHPGLHEHFENITATLTPQEAVEAMFATSVEDKSPNGLAAFVRDAIPHTHRVPTSRKRMSQVNEKWMEVIFSQSGDFLNEVCALLDQLPDKRKKEYTAYCQTFDAKLIKSMLKKNLPMPTTSQKPRLL